MWNAQSSLNINKLEQCEQYFKKSWKAWRRKGKDNTDKVFPAKFFYSKSNLLYRKKNYAEALDLAQKSLELQHELYGSGSSHYELGYCYNSIANCYKGLNKVAQAIGYYQKAIEILESTEHYNGLLHYNLAQA